MIPKFKLGKMYREKYFGFEGIAVSRTEYINGCDRVRLEKLNEKGDDIIAMVFDIVDLLNIKLPKKDKKSGGPRDVNLKRS